MKAYITIGGNKIETLDEAINGVVKVDSESGVGQNIYVIEECSELIKALTKEERGKGSKEDIVDESCDVLTTVAILLRGMGVSKEEIEDRIYTKCARAIERWESGKEA